MTERDFVHDQRAVRVVFRRGALGDVAGEVDALGAVRVLLIGSPRHAGRVAAALGSRLALTVSDPRMHVPAEQVSEVRAAAAETRVDVCVAVGGGSAVGLAKAVALEQGVPIVAAPSPITTRY